MAVRYRRMPIEIESPEQVGYDSITCNLTESSFADARLGDLTGDLVTELGSLVLCYGDHLGLPELRDAIAADAGGSLRAEHVLVSPGAVAALFFANTVLLGEPGSHLVVARPNYATNIETPRAIGAGISFLDLAFEDDFALDIDRLASLCRHGSVISLTYPHNPTGVTIDEPTLHSLVELVERIGGRLLFDETYREMVPGAPLPVAASLSDRVVSVSSLSKAFGLPGIRSGWAMTTDPVLFESLLAAKEQIVITGSIVDETLALAAWRRRDEILGRMRATVGAHRAIVAGWIDAEPGVEWVAPRGGAICFPRLGEHVDVEAFYARLATTGTMVGPGHWFEQPDRSFRLGFGWPSTDELRLGLADLGSAISAAS